MFLLSQTGFVYVKLGSRNLGFLTSAKNMTLTIQTMKVLSIRGDAVYE